MIALMMFLFLSGGAKKAAPEVAHRTTCPDPNCTNPSPVMSSGELKSNGLTYLGKFGDMYVSEPIAVPADDGSKFVKLGLIEYSHLQDLRKAVEDEEERLAVKYGAVLSNPAPCPPYCATFNGAYVWQPDRYEYHGQFLLIEKAKEDKR
jgi:hypothetical protein